MPTLELLWAAIDLIRTGFNERVVAEVSLRLHFTGRYLAELVQDISTGETRPRKEIYLERYLHGIRRDRLRDVDGSVFWGHLAAVRSHNLNNREAELIRNASFEKLVVFGHDDHVIPAGASRELARRIGAKQKSVPGAHFIPDESAQDVNLALRRLWQTKHAPQLMLTPVPSPVDTPVMIDCDLMPAQVLCLRGLNILICVLFFF